MKIFVAATNQHIGKTTTTLGLTAAIKKMGFNTGYCKPVGQICVDYNGEKVDKDAFLFSKVLDFDLIPKIHNPVALPNGTTARFLDKPNDFRFAERLHHAVSVLEKQHDVIVFEGTGHPGVGSVVELSNAEVASRLGASAIIVVEGGIGNTIDKLELSMALFREKNVPIAGVIVNKVFPEKLEKVKYYVEGWLQEKNIPLLGILPFEKDMTNPSMRTIMRAVEGQTISYRDKFSNSVEGLIAGSLISQQNLSEVSNQLLVVNIKKYKQVISQIIENTENSENTSNLLSGIILVNYDNEVFDTREILDYKNYVHQHQIPVILTALDSFGCFVKINNLKVKITPNMGWKINKAIKLFERNININSIVSLEKSAL